jgi:large subunit ribosomal protein L20
MVRATNAPQRRRRHKKLLQRTKGFRGARKNLYRIARNAAFKAGQHAYAAVRPFDLPYNRFMFGLKKAGVDLNRKMLAETAARSPGAFRSLVEVARNALNES